MALDPNRLPNLGTPVKRSQIQNVGQLRQYAAAGYRVCAAEANKYPMTNPASDTSRTRNPLYSAWDSAGSLYIQAYNMDFLSSPAAFSDGLRKLAEADRAADKARALAAPNVAAPTMEEMMQQASSPSLLGAGMSGYAAVGGILLLAFLTMRSKKHGVKPKRRRR